MELSNPPWERIKLQEEEFFAAREPSIALAANKAARQKLIEALPKTNPALAREFAEAKREHEGFSLFVRQSGRYPLTAVGDVNTYTLFAENARALIAPAGRAGIILPPGIASDETNKDFFADLMNNGSLVCLFAFVNERFIFPGVLHNFRFCLLTMTGANGNNEPADFVYECQALEDIKQVERHFTLTRSDLVLFNPNTCTAPVFRTGVDALLTRKIYQQAPVIENERTRENPWGMRFASMFHMSNDSGLFVTAPHQEYVPLYEAKMMHQFDHRFGSFGNERSHILPQTSIEHYLNPNYFVKPFYWVAYSKVKSRLSEKWSGKNWLVGFRDVTSKSLERTAIVSFLPLAGIGNSISLLS